MYGIGIKEKLDYDDYATFPPDRNHYEIMEGDLLVTLLSAHCISGSRNACSVSLKRTSKIDPSVRSSMRRSM